MISRVCAGRVLPLVIHHARKPTQEGSKAGGGPRMAIRGSSALFDALGGCFVFEGGRDRSDPVQIFHEKERLRGVRLAPFAFRIVDVANGSDPRWGLRVEVLSPEQSSGVETQRAEFQADVRKILAAIVLHPGFPLKRVRAAAGFGEAKALKCIQHLLDTDPPHIEERVEKGDNNRLTKTYYAVREFYVPPVTGGLGIDGGPAQTVNGYAHDDGDKFIGNDI